MHKMTRVVSLGGALLLASGGAGIAQGWPPWAEDLFGPNFDDEPRWESPEAPPRRDWSDEVREGGTRPQIDPQAPQIVAFPYAFQPSSIVIATRTRKLYYVLPDNQAYEYAIGVGREGFSWTGTETISRKQDWPDWHPPAEMRERDPRLPVKMTGGIRNPLGATALYLGNTLYRIHGTNDPKSIGRAESSGCFRMLNSSVLHLASLTQVGTPVTVVRSLPKQQAVTRAPQGPKAPPISKQPENGMPATPTDSAPAAAGTPDGPSPSQ